MSLEHLKYAVEEDEWLIIEIQAALHEYGRGDLAEKLFEFEYPDAATLLAAAKKYRESLTTEFSSMSTIDTIIELLER